MNKEEGPIIKDEEEVDARKPVFNLDVEVELLTKISSETSGQLHLNVLSMLSTGGVPMSG